MNRVHFLTVKYNAQNNNNQNLTEGPRRNGERSNGFLVDQRWLNFSPCSPWNGRPIANKRKNGRWETHAQKEESRRLEKETNHASPTRFEVTNQLVVGSVQERRRWNVGYISNKRYRNTGSFNKSVYWLAWSEFFHESPYNIMKHFLWTIQYQRLFLSS